MKVIKWSWMLYLLQLVIEKWSWKLYDKVECCFVKLIFGGDGTPYFMTKHNATYNFRAKLGDKNQLLHAAQVVSFVVLSTNLHYLSHGTRSRMVSYLWPSRMTFYIHTESSPRQLNAMLCSCHKVSHLTVAYLFYGSHNLAIICLLALPRIPTGMQTGNKVFDVPWDCSLLLWVLKR